MKHRELEQFWGQLNLNTQEPDQIIPKLLAKKELYNNHTVKGEIFDLLLLNSEIMVVTTLNNCLYLLIVIKPLLNS
jgi:hypothetical protein